MMRRTRFFLPFTLGAMSMLALVSALAWSFPGLLDRARLAVGPPDAAQVAAAPAGPAPPQAAAGGADSAAAAGAAAGSLPGPTPPPAAVPAVDLPTLEPGPDSAARPAVPASATGLVIPVQGVRPADLVDTYDQARSQGRRHDAIDIAAPRGTPVLAAAEGVVLKRFLSARGGTALYQLAPDRRTIYYYAHLDRYAAGIVEGRALRAGDVVGYVGNTGDAGPGNYHLHFEVSTTSDPKRYWGGVPRNPYPLLRAASGG